MVVNDYLKMILCRSDADEVSCDQDKLFNCIHMKFIIVTDLAIACKLTVQDLLKHASPRVYSNITYFLLMDEFVVDLIDKSLCGIDFFKSHILPRSWFHLLYQSRDTNSPIKLTNESLT
jgi:hypothetical protein